MRMVTRSVVQYDMPGADTVPSPCVDEDGQVSFGWPRLERDLSFILES